MKNLKEMIDLLAVMMPLDSSPNLDNPDLPIPKEITNLVEIHPIEEMRVDISETISSIDLIGTTNDLIIMDLQVINPTLSIFPCFANCSYSSSDRPLPK